MSVAMLTMGSVLIAVSAAPILRTLFKKSYTYDTYDSEQDAILTFSTDDEELKYFVNVIHYYDKEIQMNKEELKKSIEIIQEYKIVYERNTPEQIELYDREIVPELEILNMNIETAKSNIKIYKERLGNVRKFEMNTRLEWLRRKFTRTTINVNEDNIVDEHLHDG